MVSKCGELTWLEKMSQEFKNDPEYLKEYIGLCSSEIADLQKKIEKLTADKETLLNSIKRLESENAKMRLNDALVMSKIRELEEQRRISHE